MGYVLLGHGGLEVDSGQINADMGTVAIPKGTTIQFYSDTGQSLVYGSRDLDVWAQLQAPWPPLDSSNVTYNLTLSGAAELWGDELKNNPSFGGHTLLRAGIDGLPDPINLCNGTRDTCPTDPRQVAAGATHTCSGILGKYAGDLFWVACTVVQGGAQATQSVETARGSAPEDVLLGADPDTVHEVQADAPVRGLDPAIAAEVDARNREVLKNLDDGEETHFYQSEGALLIGDGHPHAAVEYLGSIRYVEGTVRIKKGGVLSAGKIYVSNCLDQYAFQDAVARISDKEVEFN